MSVDYRIFFARNRDFHHRLLGTPGEALEQEPELSSLPVNVVIPEKHFERLCPQRRPVTGREQNPLNGAY